MTKPIHWTLLDETMLIYFRTIESQFKMTHGDPFAACFLDEFEQEICKVAMQHLCGQQPFPKPAVD